MIQFGDLYSRYYDLLYRDKDYRAEVTYVESIFNRYGEAINSILDFGCGTGRHDELLCDDGYRVHGIDLSFEMLKCAELRRRGKENRLTFSQSNITEFNMNQIFDCVLSLFHVMSYLTSNKDLESALITANKHLKAGGIFLFDSWYGPAVLTDLPSNRVKRLEDDSVKVTRIVESNLQAQRNLVDVHYTLFVEDKLSGKIYEHDEDHQMRYLFDTEIEMLSSKTGFSLHEKFTWLTNEKPGFNSWNVVWVLKKL